MLIDPAIWQNLLQLNKLQTINLDPAVNPRGGFHGQSRTSAVRHFGAAHAHNHHHNNPTGNNHSAGHKGSCFWASYNLEFLSIQTAHSPHNEIGQQIMTLKTKGRKVIKLWVRTSQYKKFREFRSSHFGKVYMALSVAVIFATTLFWSLLGARLQAGNADQSD